MFRNYSDQFNHSVMSESLRPHGLQHTRLPCPSPMPGDCSNISIKLMMPCNCLILCQELLDAIILLFRAHIPQLLFSCSVMSNSLWPHRLQHTRLPCPSPMPGACSNSHLSSQWCYPTISSSAIPSSSCLRSFPASEPFLMSQFFTSGGQSMKLQLQHQSYQWIFRTNFL